MNNIVLYRYSTICLSIYPSRDTLGCSAETILRPIVPSKVSILSKISLLEAPLSVCLICIKVIYLMMKILGEELGKDYMNLIVVDLYSFCKKWFKKYSWLTMKIMYVSYFLVADCLCFSSLWWLQITFFLFGKLVVGDTQSLSMLYLRWLMTTSVLFGDLTSELGDYIVCIFGTAF